MIKFFKWIYLLKGQNYYSSIILIFKIFSIKLGIMMSRKNMLYTIRKTHNKINKYFKLTFKDHYILLLLKEIVKL